MDSMTIHEAKTHLSRLLVDVEAGHDIVICNGRRPVAKLVPFKPKSIAKRPKVGTHTSTPVTYTEDVFAPLSEKELEAWGL